MVTIPRLVIGFLILSRHAERLVRADGFGPSTFRVSGEISTTELRSYIFGAGGGT